MSSSGFSRLSGLKADHPEERNATDTDNYAHRLLLSNILREPAIRAAIKDLQLPPGSRGLDIGCGIGLHTPLLAQDVGPTGHVTGLDVSPPFLALAQERADRLCLPAPVAFQEGDMTCLPFDDNSFDWIWSADTVHPGLLNDPLAPLKEFVRVVRPGGIVALLYWSSQKLLPGHALLEARLDTAFAQSAPYIQEIQPELNFMCALGWLGEAGLRDLTARTFVADIHAPLEQHTHSALTMTFHMFWGDLPLASEDCAEFQRLCQPESPDFILQRQDYYAFLTYSLFRGKVADNGT